MPDKNVKSAVSEEIDGEFSAKTVSGVHNPSVGKVRGAMGSLDHRETVSDEMDAQSRQLDALLRRMDAQSKQMDAQFRQMDAQSRQMMDVQSKQMDALCRQVAAMGVQYGQQSREARQDRRVRLRVGDPRMDCTLKPGCVCRDCSRSVGSGRLSTSSRSSKSRRREHSPVQQGVRGGAMASLAGWILGMDRPISYGDVQRRRSGKVIVRRR